jgi:AcrR family transcriptional regulator
MINKDLNTEQTILEAAEAEFLDKGFGNAKMMAIARRAGVSHSMLHYYFRTKDNLFQMIFREKIRMLSQLFGDVSGLQLTFFETIRFIIEKQFDLMAENRRMPRFILHEIISSKDHFNVMLEAAPPIIVEILDHLGNRLKAEIEQGSVRPITIHDLIINIIALNVSSFFHLLLLERICPEMDDAMKTAYLRSRRESNVQFILNALRT